MEIVVSIIGGFIVWGVISSGQWLVTRIREQSALFTGVWEQRIFDPGPNVTKRDRVECRQSGEIVRGTIRREFPDNERFRRWAFIG
jgi:hypothetical protein